MTGLAARPGRLAAMAFVVGAALATCLPFWAVFLQERGFDPTSIGIAMSLAAIGYLIAVPLVGGIADSRIGRPNALLAVALGGGLMALLLVPVLSPLATVVLFTIAYSLIASWQPLADAITVNALGDPTRFGRVRFITSGAYSAVALAAGAVYRVAGYGAMLPLFAAASVVVAAVSRLLPDVERARSHAPATEAHETAGQADAGAGAAEGPHTAATPSPAGRRLEAVAGTTMTAFRVAPRLWLVLAAAALVCLGFVAGNTFLALRIVELGGSATEVALSASIAAAVEIPAMLLTGPMARRFGLRFLFVTSASLFAICCAVWATAPTVTIVLASRMLEGAAYSGLTASGVMTMRHLLPPALQATGQNLFAATAFGVVAVVINPIGGAIHATVGYQGLFAACTVLAVAGAVVGWYAYPKRSDTAPDEPVEGIAGEPELPLAAAP